MSWIRCVATVTKPIVDQGLCVCGFVGFEGGYMCVYGVVYGFCVNCTLCEMYFERTL